jgi:anti-sigma factor RsiW
MDARHCTSDELIQILYGIGPDPGHVRECAACAERLAGMRERRRQSVDEPFTDAELADQSRRWRARVETPRPRWSWRVAAVAATVVLAVSALAPRTPQRLTASDDQQLFEDAFRKVESIGTEPFAPLEGLFERSEP